MSQSISFATEFEIKKLQKDSLEFGIFFRRDARATDFFAFRVLRVFRFEFCFVYKKGKKWGKMNRKLID